MTYCMYSPIQRCNQQDAPFNLLYGKRYVMETINGFKFKISPYSTLPNNLFGVGVLYDTLVRRAKFNSNTTVLDIGSSTGEIYSLFEDVCD